MACATLKRSYHQMMECSPSGSPKSTVDNSCLLHSTLSEQTLFGKRYCCGISSFSANLNESCSSAAAISSPVWSNVNDTNIYLEESTVTNTEDRSPALENVSPPKMINHPFEPIEEQSRNPQRLTTISKVVSSRSSSALKTRFLEEVKRLERRGGLLSSNKGSAMSNSHGASKDLSQSQPSLIEDAHLSNQTVQDCMISLSQAYQLCNRIWRDREAQLRQVYEEALLERLTEQYELFARRVEGLIHSRSSTMPPPSYVS